MTWKVEPAAPKSSATAPSQSLGRGTVFNAGWNLVPLVWSSVLGLITIPIVVKAIGLQHFGVAGLFSILLTPLNLANLGFADATIKFVAQYARAGDLATCAQFIRNTLFFNLLVGICGAVAIATLGPWCATRIFHIAVIDRNLVEDCVRLVAATWLINQISSVFMGIPPAFQQFRFVAVGQLLITTMNAILSIGMVKSGFGLYGYIAAGSLGALFALAVWLALGWRLLPGRNLSPRLDRATYRRAFDFGLWRALAQLGGLLANQSERFILGYFLAPTALGLYNIAFNLEERVYTVVFKMAEVLFPLFSSMETESRERRLSMLLRSTWLLTTLAVCALMPMVALARPLLSAWISPEMGQKASLLLQVMSVAGMLGCATNASHFYILGIGKTKWGALLTLVTGLVTIGVSATLVPRFGLKVAAVSAVLAMLAQQVVLTGWMLPSLFGNALRFPKLFLSFYGPVCIGLLLAFLLSGAFALDGWRLTSLVPLYAVLAAGCGCIIVMTYRVLPGGREHLRDVEILVALVTKPFAKSSPTVCVE